MLGSNSQKLEEVGPRIAEHIRNEVGATASFPYEVEEPGAAGEGSPYWREITGGSAVLLCHLHFDLQGPRLVHLRISMNKGSMLGGCDAGLLLYTTQLSKTVNSDVSLADPKFWGRSKFIGDDSTCWKLNFNDELVKLANVFSRTEYQQIVGGATLRIKRLFSIIPQESGSLLVVGTLPAKVFLQGESLQIRQFFEVASMIEATL
jgi:hypothetical protein